MAAMTQPRLQHAQPAAARRAGPAGEARGARRGDQEERLPAAGARPDGDLGRRLHPARQPVPRHGPEGRRRRRRRCFATTSPTEGKPIGELETNLEQLGFFDKLPEKAQRAAARRSDRQPSKRGRRNSTAMLARLVARRRQARSPGRFNHDLAASPELRAGADQAAATPTGASGSSSGWRSRERS